jgi:hypothetical protein
MQPRVDEKIVESWRSRPDLQCRPERWASASTLDPRALRALATLESGAGYPAFDSRCNERIDSGLML